MVQTVDTLEAANQPDTPPSGSRVRHRREYGGGGGGGSVVPDTPTGASRQGRCHRGCGKGSK